MCGLTVTPASDSFKHLYYSARRVAVGILDMGLAALIDHRTSVRSNFCFKREVTMAATSTAPHPPVRLTRRGRLAVLLTLVLLAAGLVALVAAPGQAADPAGAPPTTIVLPGDTLWSVAGRSDPGRDRFQVIDEIRTLNGISGYTVHPGQRLILPRHR
jgi:hypothetical protein